MRTITLTVRCGEYNVCDSLRDLANFIEGSEMNIDDIAKTGCQGDDYEVDIKIVDPSGLKYYQPEFKYPESGVPDELADYNVFPSEEECIAWLENKNYVTEDFDIQEYKDDDIEGFVMIDRDNNVITTSDEDILDQWFESLEMDDLGTLFPSEYEHTLESADPEDTLDSFYDEMHDDWDNMDINRKMQLYKEYRMM